MILKNSIAQAIFSAVDELNEQLPAGQKLSHSLATRLFSSDGKLDSLAFVTLIVGVEQEIQQKFHIDINLTDQTTITQHINPFETIGTLLDYLSELLEGQQHE
jgi:acyl carrier protein